MNNTIFYTKKEDKNKRLDQFLKEQNPDISRSIIRSVIQSGDVKIGFKVVDDIEFPVETHKKIIFNYDPNKKYSKAVTKSSKHAIEVIYDDRDIIVIEKGTGTLSAPSRRRERDTVLHHINNYMRSKYHIKFHTTHLVHLIDKETSGVMIYAKTKTAQTELKRQIFENISTYKYEAIVAGRFDQNEGKISSFLANENKRASRVESEEDGELAETNFKVIKKLKNKATFLEVIPLTTKKNQIRFQLSDIGHPILGDSKFTKYKSDLYNMPRLALHLSQIEIIHPRTKKKEIFTSTLPTIMKRFIQQ